ncbi:MAG: MFS transporter [Clostridium sp.]|nr:MFS transporter [Clostridium sp.]
MENINDSGYKNRWIILFTVLSATFMATLDGSIVNVALPDMATKLNVSTSAIEWVVTSFLIVVSAAILLFGRLGDIIGKVKVFKFGLILFTFGSFLCGLTDSLTILILARIIQAIGASATMATNQGIITHVFPANERGRALGIVGTFVALGAMVGPPLGGIIVSMMNWKYIFLINVPIGIIVFFMTVKVFPKSQESLDEKLDIKGALLFMVSIIMLFVALEEGQNNGFNSGIVICFIASIIIFALFIFVEMKSKEPLLDLNIFKNSLFTISIICAFISFTAISASNIILPFYFQNAQGYSAEIAGLLMMVSPITLSIVAPFSGYASDKIGSEILTLVGLIFTSIGLLLISTLHANSLPIYFIGFIVIMTVGNGMFQSPNNSLVMSTVTKDKLGIAGSVNGLVRNIGMVSGTSFSTLLLYNRMSYKIGYRVNDFIKGREDVFMYGMKWVYICAAILCIIGSVITAVRYIKSKKRNSNEDGLKNVKSA